MTTIKMVVEADMVEALFGDAPIHAARAMGGVHVTFYTEHDILTMTLKLNGMYTGRVWDALTGGWR